MVEDPVLSLRMWCCHHVTLEIAVASIPGPEHLQAMGTARKCVCLRPDSMWGREGEVEGVGGRGPAPGVSCSPGGQQHLERKEISSRERRFELRESRPHRGKGSFCHCPLIPTGSLITSGGT